LRAEQSLRSITALERQARDTRATHLQAACTPTLRTSSVARSRRPPSSVARSFLRRLTLQAVPLRDTLKPLLALRPSMKRSASEAELDAPDRGAAERAAGAAGAAEDADDLDLEAELERELAEAEDGHDAADGPGPPAPGVSSSCLHPTRWRVATALKALHVPCEGAGVCVHVRLCCTGALCLQAARGEQAAGHPNTDPAVAAALAAGYGD